jgi:predicted ATP-dependent endonuclease of OLD family
MKLIAFRVQMYKCFIDSGWIEITPLTVMVGKNEAGKTSLLKALHKFKPFKPEPYSMDREWPRGKRDIRDEKQVVTTARFELEDAEKNGLTEILGNELKSNIVEICRNYAGQYFIPSPPELIYSDILPDYVKEVAISSLQKIDEVAGETFKHKAQQVHDEACNAIRNGKFADLVAMASKQQKEMQQSLSAEQAPERKVEEIFVEQHTAKLIEIASQLVKEVSNRKKANEYLINRIPTLIFMSEYRAFTGGAQLDQVKQRKDRGQLNEEDKTLITILDLAGLDLNKEVEKGNSQEREQRQYDIDDASATLTEAISQRWKQRRYEVQFRADGQSFYTFVKDEKDPSLIRLEERSKGFQWFFSFDLMFMYESKGTFKGCVILLDEPGLHLHPDAQRDLLRRMEEYAKENILIYTTHLPFMIDLTKPERIRVLSETSGGSIVTYDLTSAQPEARFVLQAALGMNGSTSYLLSKRNLIVEGVDDYWIITELSNLFKRMNKPAIQDDIFITPAGGASEAAYLATFMIGQKLGVCVLLDSDKAGQDARDALVKKWITRYQSHSAKVLSLGEIMDTKGREFAIEDIFPEEYFLERVKRVYNKQIAAAGAESIKLTGDDQLVKRVERAMENIGITYNKGSVAKIIRSELSRMKDISELPEETRTMSSILINAIIKSFPDEPESS